MNQVNEDLAFPHYLHIVDHTMVRLRHTHFCSLLSETNYERQLQVSKLVLQGDMEVTFAGVVDMGSQYNH